MNKFMIFLIAVFVFLFVMQQSHLIEKQVVFDPLIRAPKDEYVFRWDNLINYFVAIGDGIKGVPQSIGNFFSR